MYKLIKGDKVFTCPDETFRFLAITQANDRNDPMKDKIVNDDAAIAYMMMLGFEVNHIQDKPITKIPTSYEADWYNPQHRALYDEINDKSYNGIPLTEAEREFDIAMYHAEEASAGLL